MFARGVALSVVDAALSALAVARPTSGKVDHVCCAPIGYRGTFSCLMKAASSRCPSDREFAEANPLKNSDNAQCRAEEGARLPVATRGAAQNNAIEIEPCGAIDARAE